MHWLTRPQLADVYSIVGALLAGGGVFVNGDHLHETAQLDQLQTQIARNRAARMGTLAAENWTAWWAAVGQAPELAGLLGDRDPRPIDHSVPDAPTLADHKQLLRAAGFREVGTVWQHGDDRVLIALR